MKQKIKTTKPNITKSKRNFWTKASFN